MSRYNVTTSIPYVNGRPHIGHALELVQVDVLARHRRQRGDEVRAQTGTDDNALKNVHSAEAARVTPAVYVARVAERFRELGAALGTGFDDFIRTGSDPRHAPGVAELWAACADDFYRREYTGLYCVGCELFYPPGELVDGRCPEHGTVPEEVTEENWFFRLSRYQHQVERLVADDVVRVEPLSRKKEVLAFVRSGLEDFSVSRGVARARGWGVPVPGDPGQVVYVWFDALANYLTAPGYGTDDEGFRHWWDGADERVHVIGKGIVRFHAVYWPAMLLSAGLAQPTTIFVHEYLTAGGEKISKSLGNAEDPAAVIATHGTDAVRWWLLREVARAGDTDYTPERLVARANEDLANNIGNLVNRTLTMLTRYGPAHGDDPRATTLRAARAEAAATIDHALADFDFRRAVEAVTRIATEANRYIQSTKPWALAKRNDPTLPAVLGELLTTCHSLATHLTPFLPAAAARIQAQCDGTAPIAPVFPRL
ncbi:methionine--tRNA ligase [Umezawaea tangerina]|uniref:Methionine--tRNA ligase n=1 Tax=Umezawaea tangerina TaxID=84725 RepID=A0A2T0SCC7_9PSEU|nr:methionine--tRNA ligase [Umezawaea tangerina]PRY30973.1 methionyl-tRNA synthetase [Umezawaea tangerina]